jgi:hypothetical protein
MAGMENYPRYSHNRQSCLNNPIQSQHVSGEVLLAYEPGSQARFRPKACEDEAFEGDGEYLRIGVKHS